jgi:hypothetical protein
LKASPSVYAVVLSRTRHFHGINALTPMIGTRYFSADKNSPGQHESVLMQALMGPEDVIRIDSTVRVELHCCSSRRHVSKNPLPRDVEVPAAYGGVPYFRLVCCGQHGNNDIV